MSHIWYKEILENLKNYKKLRNTTFLTLRILEDKSIVSTEEEYLLTKLREIILNTNLLNEFDEFSKNWVEVKKIQEAKPISTIYFDNVLVEIYHIDRHLYMYFVENRIRYKTDIVFDNLDIDETKINEMIVNYWRKLTKSEDNKGR